MMHPSTANVWSFADLRFPWWPALSAAALAGVVLGVAISSVDLKGSGIAGEPSDAPILRELPHRPIPLEWRWSPPGVKTDHMFRKAR
jgi:hypothetical protein